MAIVLKSSGYKGVLFSLNISLTRAMLLESTFYKEYFLFVYLLVETTSKAAAIPRFVEEKNLFFLFFQPDL